jgi:dTDP-4-amino-4,6-dideoxygalactose transaminase
VSTSIKRTIPLLDLQAQHRTIREEVLATMTRVVDSQQFILGGEVRELETELAAYCRTKYAIGCASGSDALFLALLALDIGPGDEVLTTPYTFFATAGAISRTGAVPVFADIEERTFNLDVNRLRDVLEAHPRVRAIIPVDLYGGCADLDPICEMAQSKGIAVVEDAAQSIGSEYKGRRAGSMTEIGTFSFFPSKNLGAFGDGGMLTTDNQALAEKLAALRVHGSVRKYYHQWIGINSRLDALQAAVLRVKLRYLDRWTEGRQRNAAHYRTRLATATLPIVLPEPAAWQTRHIYNQFVIRCADRDELRNWLKQEGIGTEIYYPLPLHLQACFAGLGYAEGAFPVAERMAKESLALPIHPELTSEDIDYICGAIAEFYARR